MSRRPAPPAGWSNRALVRLTTGARVTNHAILAARAVFQQGRSRGWLAAAGASLAVDLVLARKLTDPDHVPGWPRWAVGWIDCALWAHATESRADVMGLIAADGVMPTVEAAFGAFAGTTAVPVHHPARPWPPEGRRDWADRALRIAATAAVPLEITARVRRRRGLDAAREHLMAVTAAAVLSAVAARHRDRLHRAERRRWTERTDIYVDREHDAARATMALTSSPGHDFKKTLFALGHHGSHAAFAEAHHQARHPGRVHHDVDGQTLFELTRSDRIVPVEAGAMWLTHRQAGELDRFLVEAERTAMDGADQEIRVSETVGGTTTIAYLGRRLVVRNEPPPLRALLYPTSLVLAVGAIHIGHTVVLGELPAVLAAPSIALLAVAARRFWHRPPTDDDLGLLLATSMTAAALGIAASATRWAPAVAPLGYRPTPAGAFAKTALLVLASHWSRLRPRHRLLLPVTIVGWAAACRRRAHQRPIELVVGVLDLLQIVASTWRVTDLVDGEAHHLEGELRAEFTARCDAGRRAGVARELDRYRRQLEVARRGLDDLSASLPPPVRVELEADCAALDRWLAAERARLRDPAVRG